MVARGDLGIEVHIEELPVVQRTILRECARIGRKVIVATHMLESMVENPVPTRAEITDVANAVYRTGRRRDAERRDQRGPLPGQVCRGDSIESLTAHRAGTRRGIQRRTRTAHRETAQRASRGGTGQLAPRIGNHHLSRHGAFSPTTPPTSDR